MTSSRMVRPKSMALPPPVSGRSPWKREGDLRASITVDEAKLAANVEAEGDAELWTQNASLNGVVGRNVVRYSHVASLLPGHCPCLEAVVWYSLMLQREAATDPQWKRSWIFHPQFLDDWREHRDIVDVAGYTSGVNIFRDVQAVLFPIRETDDHWTLIAALPRNVSETFIVPIVYLDPLAQFNQEVAKDVLQYLERERERLGMPRIVMNLRNAPLPRSFMEPDLIDCGVALLAHMRSVLDGSKLGLDVSMVRRMRIHVVQEMLSNGIVPTGW